MFNKRLKNLKIINKGTFESPKLPMIIENRNKGDLSVIKSKKSDINFYYDIKLLNKNYLVNSHEISFQKKNTAIPLLSKSRIEKQGNFVRMNQTSPNSAEYLKKVNRSLAKINIKKSPILNEQQLLIFTNPELVSKIKRIDNLNDFSNRPSKVVDLYQMTKNKIKHESGNIFFQGFNLDRAPHLKLSQY